MTGAEGIIAKATAKTVIALFKKWYAGYQLDKDIDEVFNRAFDKCPDAILVTCHQSPQFRDALLGLAISQNVDAAKLLERATAAMSGKYDRQEVCQQLFDFSNELQNQCYAHKRKALGDIPGVCADFKDQMNVLLLAGRSGQTVPAEAKQAPPPVYIPHRPTLCCGTTSLG